jgi:hypothetical protein
MKIKSIIAASLLVSTAALGGVPTDSQVKEAIRQIKTHLADTLKDPSSYKEGDWKIWTRTDPSGNVIVRCVHEYSAKNGFGGRVSGMIIALEEYRRSHDKWDRPTGSPQKGWWFITDLSKNLDKMIYENMIVEMVLIPEGDMITIKAKRILGKEVVN